MPLERLVVAPLVAAGPPLAVLLAQDVPTTLLAPWTTAGLAGLILGWLFFWHIPAGQKQLTDLLTAKDNQITNLLTAKDKQVSELMAGFDAKLSRARKDCAEETERVILALQTQHAADRDAFKTVTEAGLTSFRQAVDIKMKTDQQTILLLEHVIRLTTKGRAHEGAGG